jgi:hypothetical protein
MSTSIIRSHYNKAIVRHRMGETEENIYEGVLAGLTGFGLGFANAKLKGGLDVSVKVPFTKSTVVKGPIDLAVGAAGLAAGVFLPAPTGTRDKFRSVAATAFGVGVFRQTEKFMAAKAAHHGETIDDPFDHDLDYEEEDPILAAARML